MNGPKRRLAGNLGIVASALVAASLAIAASKSVNLDGKSANGAESAVALNILSSFPAKVENKITNRAVGDSYRFTWPSAGPGGFSSQVGAGTTSGVGATWVWQTSQTIYSFTGSSCQNDVCFSRVAGPDPAPTNSPAWAVPGRTLVPNSVTLTSASLTASLITFFSPPQVLVTATSSTQLLASGQIGYTTTYTNDTGSPVELVVPPGPPGCCEGEDQLNCDGACVDYLSDEDNCGECGYSCYDECGGEGLSLFEEGGPYCDWGWCYCDGGYGARTDERTTATTGRPATLAASPASDVIVGARGFEGNAEAAPLCETPGFTTVLGPGESTSECRTSEFLPMEVPGVLTVCGTAIPDGVPTCDGGAPASQGTFMQLVPDPDHPIPTGDAFLSPFQVQIVDGNGDGVLQPGESGMLFVSVINVGTETVTEPEGDLSSEDVDLTDDGATNPELISITQASSPYSPDAAAIVPVGGSDCDAGPAAPVPSTNTMAFVVSVPIGHTEDVIRPFLLEVTGMVNGDPRTYSVPFTLGIGSNDPPAVEILEPALDQTGLPPLAYPVRVRFRVSSTAEIEREVLSLESCTLRDGLIFGDRDGLLSDESLQVTKVMLCQAMARCGMSVLYYPRLRVTSTDVFGRSGTDDVILRKNLLRTEACR